MSDSEGDCVSCVSWQEELERCKEEKAICVLQADAHIDALAARVNEAEKKLSERTETLLIRTAERDAALAELEVFRVALRYVKERHFPNIASPKTKDEGVIGTSCMQQTREVFALLDDKERKK